MIINTLYDIGDMVFVKTDKDQSVRLITDIKIHPSNLHSYGLMSGSTYSSHYEMELSKEKNEVFTMKD